MKIQLDEFDSLEISTEIGHLSILLGECELSGLQDDETSLILDTKDCACKWSYRDGTIIEVPKDVKETIIECLHLAIEDNFRRSCSMFIKSDYEAMVKYDNKIAALRKAEREIGKF